MKKILFLLALVLIVSFASVQAASTVKLELACFPAIDAAYAKLMPEFNKKHPNIQVEIKSLGYGDHHNALVTAVAAGEGVPDIAVIEIGYIAQFVAEGGLVDLNKAPYRAKKYKKNITPYKWAQSTTDDGRLIAFPVDIAPACAYYRRDKFAEAKIDIEDVKTMEDLFAAAGKLTKDTDGDGKFDHWFIGDAQNIAWMILRSNPSQMLYFDKKGNTMVTSQRFKDAFNWAQKFQQAGYAAGIGAWSNEWYEGFRTGTVAYEPSGAWLGGHLKNWMAPETAGKWGVAKWPALKAGQKTMAGNWGGSFMSIPEAAKNKKEAWKFIEFACTTVPAQVTSFIVSDAFPSWMPAWEDKVFDEEMEFFGGQKARKVWIEIAKAVPEVVTNKFDNVANAIIGSELAAVINEGKSVDKALSDAKAQIERRTRRG
jgi:multiple sugar transport system substrate-binding protein